MKNQWCAVTATQLKAGRAERGPSVEFKCPASSLRGSRMLHIARRRGVRTRRYGGEPYRAAPMRLCSITENGSAALARPIVSRKLSRAEVLYYLITQLIYQVFRNIQQIICRRKGAPNTAKAEAISSTVDRGFAESVSPGQASQDGMQCRHSPNRIDCFGRHMTSRFKPSVTVIWGL